MDLEAHLQCVLNEFLIQHPMSTSWVVGLSGGLDSVVLLHALSRITISGTDRTNPSQSDVKHIIPKRTGIHSIASPLRKCDKNLRAIHINHNLQPEASEWANFCGALCHSLNISLTIKTIDAQAKAGESPEVAARDARYTCLAQCLKTNEVLCIAHHQDDQAETLLLQLLRGAGLKGLSAMPFKKSFADSQLLRPLLNTPRKSLERYAKEHDLNWIDDPSNANQRYDRNFIRHAILPKLQERWPSVNKTLSRTSQHMQAAVNTIDQHIASYLKPNTWQQTKLPLHVFNNVTHSTQQYILRHWLQYHDKPIPTHTGINIILSEVIHASIDAQPKYTWNNSTLRRYQGYLYLLNLSDLSNPLPENLIWDLRQSLVLPQGILTANKVKGQGITCHQLRSIVFKVQCRQAGERFHPATRGGSHPLKKLMQEWQIPPWERDHYPLLYLENQLIAVPNYAIANGMEAKAEEEGWVVSLT